MRVSITSLVLTLLLGEATAARSGAQGECANTYPMLPDVLCVYGADILAATINRVLVAHFANSTAWHSGGHFGQYPCAKRI